MNNNRFSLLFYFKKPKKHAGNGLPIYMRISVGCQRTEISTQRRWEPSRWNIAAGRASGTKEDARSLNTYLDTLQGRVYEAQRQLIADNLPVTIDKLRQRLGGEKRKSRMLIEIFGNHNEQLRLLVDKDFAPGTLERYETALSHTVSFLQWKFKTSDIDILDLSFEFVTEFEFWLKSERNCSHNTSVKYISNLKKIINICLKNGWLQRDPFTGYKMNKREVVREILSQEEIDRIANKVFPTDRLAIVRDIFLFSCYTGLAYADVKKLKRTEITTGMDGEQWIFTHRKKTEAPSRIPLLPAALRILQKYENNLLCLNKGVLLPMSSNQKVNAYLKEIADVCGITKKMTFHIARHTFATTVTLTNGVPIETVGKMLGHRNLKTTQHYAKILDKKVSDDMLTLRAKLDSRIEAPSPTL
ncbi:MAG: site-specific integrase [Cytophagales bacterium]|jgi:site-specific recombinase XerD|nr:site-specific integrase [Cytophagales bacterium]